jgi:hypothetical protein
LIQVVGTTVDARGVRTIDHIMTGRQHCLPMRGKREIMAQVKDELLVREITSKELQVLVDEYLANGGVITICPPGSALNFRSAMDAPSKTAQLKRPAITRQKRQSPKKAAKTKKK